MARPGLALDRRAPAGPYDGDDHDTVDVPGLVDFGAVRVPVPRRATVSVEPAENGRPQAVHLTLPEGRLSVSALAAPKSAGLWPDLAREIDASLRENGSARVRSFPGDWGRELHATSGEATSVFLGVDGARWMLYGVATGPTAHARVLDVELRRMLRGTTVVRGRSAYPVRTVLPLVVPDTLPEPSEQAAPRPPAGRPTPPPAPARVPRNGAGPPVAPRAVQPQGRPVPGSAGSVPGRSVAARSGAPVPGPVRSQPAPPLSAPDPATPYRARPSRPVGPPAAPTGPWTAPVPSGWHAKPPGRRQQPARRPATRPAAGPVPGIRPPTARSGSEVSSGRRAAGPPPGTAAPFAGPGADRRGAVDPRDVHGAPQARPAAPAPASERSGEPWGGGVGHLQRYPRRGPDEPAAGTVQVGGRHAAGVPAGPGRPDASGEIGSAPVPASAEHAGRHSAPESGVGGTHLSTGRPGALARPARPGGRRQAPEEGSGRNGGPSRADQTSRSAVAPTAAPSGRHSAPEPRRAAPPAPDGAGRHRRPD